MQPEALAVSSAAEVIVPPHVASIIPLAHHEEFHNGTTPEQKLRVGFLLKVFDEMRSAPEGVVAAAHRLALLHRGERGMSVGNLKALYYAFRKTGDWRVLIHKYRGAPALPSAFVEFFRMRVEQNVRGARAAMIDIKAAWAAGESIPGFGTWREYYTDRFPERDIPERYPYGFYPAGWSESNLYERQSSKAERALKRRGFAAMKRHLPHVQRDLSQLRPLELIVIDDFETDQIVQARDPDTGRYELTTCTGLLAIDAATRRKLALGLKPRFKREDGRRIAITRADVQQLLYSVFTEHGTPRDYGVTILCENSAAAITPDFELALETLLGVQVARTGLLAEKTLRNGFVERGGKPWEKPWIESTFNLLHNRAGALPGQKGASYQLKPGDLEAKLLYSEKLLAIEGLAPEVVAQLQTPFWTDGQLLAAYERIFDAMENRDDHRLQGFEERVGYLLPDRSAVVDASALMTLSREEILACECKPRMETPRERWERLMDGVRRVKVAPIVLACLLLTPKRCALKRHKITFEHLGTGYTFADADSEVMSLPEGTELLGYFDAERPDVLFIADLKGKPLGKLRRRGAIDIRDRAALANEQTEVERIIARCVTGPVRARHAAEDAQLVADNAHNVALLRANGIPDSAIPTRLLPPAGKAQSAPALAHSTTDTAQPSPAATSSLGVSAKLARQAPARDAFTAHREALARGIAGHTTEHLTAAAKVAAISASDDLDSAAML